MTAGSQWATDAPIKRHERNPVLTAEDVPYGSGLVFNAGVTKFQGKYLMVFEHGPVVKAGHLIKDEKGRWKVKKFDMDVVEYSYDV